MSTTFPIATPVVVAARDLFVLYSKKAAFTIEEYADCGMIFKNLQSAIDDAKKSDAKTADLTEQEIKYVVGAVNVCSQRVPTEVVNYKAIAELVEVFSAALPQAEEEETKSEE